MSYLTDEPSRKGSLFIETSLVADPGKQDSLVDDVQQDDPGQLSEVHPGDQLLVDLEEPFRFSGGAQNKSGRTAIQGFAIRQLRQRVSDYTPADYYDVIISY